jgi:hypothetical protein
MSDSETIAAGGNETEYSSTPSEDNPTFAHQFFDRPAMLRAPEAEDDYLATLSGLVPAPPLLIPVEGDAYTECVAHCSSEVLLHDHGDHAHMASHLGFEDESSYLYWLDEHGKSPSPQTPYHPDGMLIPDQSVRTSSRSWTLCRGAEHSAPTPPAPRSASTSSGSSSARTMHRPRPPSCAEATLLPRPPSTTETTRPETTIPPSSARRHSWRRPSSHTTTTDTAAPRRTSVVSSRPPGPAPSPSWPPCSSACMGRRPATASHAPRPRPPAVHCPQCRRRSPAHQTARNGPTGAATRCTTSRTRMTTGTRSTSLATLRAKRRADRTRRRGRELIPAPP